jgi:hypothetical protein
LLNDYYLYEKNISFQLILPYCHHCNAADRAIRSFKDHLIADLCSRDKTFPMHLWDRVLSQAVITLNMLRTSRINPKLSAETYFDGQNDYNRAPLAPPITISISHDTTHRRRTWAPHGQDGWYIGPALEHYRCYALYINNTHSERIIETVEQKWQCHFCQQNTWSQRPPRNSHMQCYIRNQSDHSLRSAMNRRLHSHVLWPSLRVCY